MWMTSRIVLVTGVIVAGLASPAGADSAFVLQPAVALGTSLSAATTPTNTASPGVPSASSALVPTARLGVQLDGLALLFSASYSTAGVSGKAVDALVHVGALGEPIVWRSDDDRTRMYGLIGVGLVAVEAPVVGQNGFTTASDTGVTAQLGVGGEHAIDGNLWLGLELFAQVDYLGDGPYVGSATYVAFTGSFTTGSHARR